MALQSLFATLGKNLADPSGLYALLLLVPLIIIYLIKPKPTKKIIPALMFFLRDTGKSPIRSLFEHFFKDPLLILQILVLIIGAAAIAMPFTEVSRMVSGEEVVLVIDASASSQTMYDKAKGMTRFDEELDLARGLVGKKTTIIVAGSTPEILGEEMSAEEALDALRTLKPKDTPTNIYDAMIVAGNYLEGSGAVFVMSDFIQTEDGLDVETAKSLLETRGMKVFFKKVFKKAKNIGIIGIDVREDKTILQVKNFNDDAAEVIVKAGAFEDTITLEPKSTEIVSFTTPQVTTKVELVIPSGHDDMKVDNEAFVTFPQGRQIKVLLITNDHSKYLQTALGVISYVQLTTTTPPRVPDIGDYQVIITQNADGSLILPGVMRDIKKKVEQGGALVIMAQDGLFQIDFQGMLPVGYNSMRDDADVHTVMEMKFTKDVNFGHVERHFDTTLDAGMSLAETAEEVPMLVLKGQGQGNVVYYGIMDDESSFKMDMYYPIFWKRLLDFLTSQKDITNINLKTGEVKYLDSEMMVKLPDSKRVKTNRLLLEHAGRYTQGDEEFVVSLADGKESDINGESSETKTALVQETDFLEKRKIDLTRWFVIACFFVIFLELLFIKLRGDV